MHRACGWPAIPSTTGKPERAGFDADSRSRIVSPILWCPPLAARGSDEGSHPEDDASLRIESVENPVNLHHTESTALDHGWNDQYHAGCDYGHDGRILHKVKMILL